MQYSNIVKKKEKEKRPLKSGDQFDPLLQKKKIPLKLVAFTSTFSI